MKESNKLINVECGDCSHPFKSTEEDNRGDSMTCPKCGMTSDPCDFPDLDTLEVLSGLDNQLRKLEKSILGSWGLKNINGGFVDIEVVDYDDNVINVKITGGSEDDTGSDITTRFGKLNITTLEWIKEKA